MEKVVFKNEYVNIVIGFLLILFAILGYFFGWIEDALPIIFAIVLALFSTKRFIFSFRKAISKNTALILAIEYALDLIALGLLIYLQDYIGIFVGIIIYLRGVSYLIINYVVTRKVQVPRYILNIFFITLGSFFMFYKMDSLLILTIFVIAILVIFGAIYIFYGFKVITKRDKVRDAKLKVEKEKQKVKRFEEKTEKQIEKLDEKLDDKVKESEQEQKKIIATQIKPNLQPTKVKQQNYSELTIAELKIIAKEKGVTGVSQLNKAQIIEKLNEKK